MRRLSDLMGLRHEDTKVPSVPKDVAVFVVGDIHGCIQPLAALHQKISELASDLPSATRKLIVYLGDYGGYGTDSCDVVDLLVSSPLASFKPIYLLGDQDLNFLRFLRGGRDILRGDQKLVRWLNDMGGIETLRSYGVDIRMAATPLHLVDMRTELLRKMPTDHISFYQNLQMSYQIGDFFFAHAGASSHRDLNEQLPSDLLSLGRAAEEQNSHASFDKIVIHGHAEQRSRHPKQSRICVGAHPLETGVMNGLLIAHEKLMWVDTTTA